MRNRTSERAAPSTLTGMWAQMVERQPDALAVRDDDTDLSYAELDAFSDAVARVLLVAGVCPEDRVALHLKRGVGVFAAILGVLKAGGAYVAIDPRYPSARRDMMIEQSGAQVVLTEPDWIGSIQAATILALPSAESGPGAPLPPASVLPKSAACVLFTSGSAGTPKATVLEHHSMAAFARNSALPALTPQDRVGQISSLSFDAFHYEMWTALAYGAQIVVLPSLTDLLAADLQGSLRRLRITAMLVPTMAVNHLVKEDRDAFSPLRILHTGGDVILADTCRNLRRGAFTGRLFNLYGPTEATTACTAFEVHRLPPEADNVPIGHALEGAVVYVLNEDLQPVESALTGQLFVGGTGVARGYLGNPGLTAERFLPNPFRADGSRMYATGDLVRQRSDGEIEFIGRADHQIKVRGYRVEPGEVERLLCRHEEVGDAAVLACGHGQDRTLVAFVVRRGGLQPDELRAFASKTIPDYMIPSTIMIVPTIPATDHGKRDWKALQDLWAFERVRARAYVAPASDGERILAGIWARLMSLETVGAADDFFAVGGNSMLAFRVRQRVKRETGVEMDFRDILARPVLRDLAELLEASMQKAVRA